MCKPMLEIKKARSVRFNDDALETVYPILSIEELCDMQLFGLDNMADDNDDCFQHSYATPLKRSGSHESLYEKLISCETTTNLIRKKRDNDLDDSNHQRNINQHHHHMTFTPSVPTTMKQRDHHRGSCHEDLDVSRHERRHERRVICF
jgi:hypothetical protein